VRCDELDLADTDGRICETDLAKANRFEIDGFDGFLAVFAMPSSILMPIE